VDYTFGIAANNVLKKRSESLLEQAQAQFAATSQPQCWFDAFWYQAGTGSTSRWAIVKAEANAQGTNRRFIVTNRSAARTSFSVYLWEVDHRLTVEARDGPVPRWPAFSRTLRIHFGHIATPLGPLGPLESWQSDFFLVPTTGTAMLYGSQRKGDHVIYCVIGPWARGCSYFFLCSCPPER
jgi:hypothetical protein